MGTNILEDLAASVYRSKILSCNITVIETELA